jgi:nitrite reductase/ring-hydroxylating ferredoxin subunit/uncharacterized membrane protein
MRALLSRFAARLGGDERLDRAADPLADAVNDVIPAGPAKDALSGVWLGHALHPMLTDLPIGFWTSAFMLDLIGGRAARKPARQLVGLGVLSAVPAMLAGGSDWSDTTGPARRIGLVHAAANTTAVACYGASWWHRRRGRHLRGITYGMIGATAATVGGYLGGHLLQELGVGVDNTAFETRPDEWTHACPEAELSGQPRAVQVDGASVIVFRHHDRPVALGGRCPHRGAPMEEGTVEGEAVVCPWHGSRFCIADGSIEQGPAATPLPAYDCRVHDDQVEIRARS